MRNLLQPDVSSLRLAIYYKKEQEQTRLKSLFTKFISENYRYLTSNKIIASVLSNLCKSIETCQWIQRMRLQLFLQKNQVMVKFFLLTIEISIPIAGRIRNLSKTSFKYRRVRWINLLLFQCDRGSCRSCSGLLQLIWCIRKML